MANEIERSHLDCFKVWRYRGHLLFPRCLSRPGIYASDRTTASLPSDGLSLARGERSTFLIRGTAKVIRSDRQRRVLSHSPVGQVSQAFQCASPFTHGTSVCKRQRSLRSKMV